MSDETKQIDDDDDDDIEAPSLFYLFLKKGKGTDVGVLGHHGL